MGGTLAKPTVVDRSANDGRSELASTLNVNEASQAELDAIEGLAGHGFEIVRYRGERGRFTDLRQLDEVPGMSGVADAAILARLKIE